jgi:hypothetical protein
MSPTLCHEALENDDLQPVKSTTRPSPLDLEKDIDVEKGAVELPCAVEMEEKPAVPHGQDDVYDRFSPRRKTLIVAIVSFAAFLSRKSSLRHSSAVLPSQVN